jgi:hypothetical protein
VRLTLSLLLLPIMLLSACGDQQADEGRSATGEVLEGTISDDMLPLATVRSQPPLLPPEEQDPESDEAATPGAPGAVPSPAATPDEGTAPAPSPAPTLTPPPPPAP